MKYYFFGTDMGKSEELMKRLIPLMTPETLDLLFPGYKEIVNRYRIEEEKKVQEFRLTQFVKQDKIREHVRATLRQFRSRRIQNVQENQEETSIYCKPHVFQNNRKVLLLRYLRNKAK